MESFEHPFYDIEIEAIDAGRLVKILSIDGRRFTYELRAPLTEEAIAYIKSLIDATVFGDQIIESTPDGFECRETREGLKRHS